MKRFAIVLALICLSSIAERPFRHSAAPLLSMDGVTNRKKKRNRQRIAWNPGGSDSSRGLNSTESETS
jgi:hypothetical protein